MPRRGRPRRAAIAELSLGRARGGRDDSRLDRRAGAGGHAQAQDAPGRSGDAASDRLVMRETGRTLHRERRIPGCVLEPVLLFLPGRSPSDGRRRRARRGNLLHGILPSHRTDRRPRCAPPAVRRGAVEPDPHHPRTARSVLGRPALPRQDPQLRGRRRPLHLRQGRLRPRLRRRRPRLPRDLPRSLGRARRPLQPERRPGQLQRHTRIRGRLSGRASQYLLQGIGRIHLRRGRFLSLVAGQASSPPRSGAERGRPAPSGDRLEPPQGVLPSARSVDSAAGDIFAARSERVLFAGARAVVRVQPDEASRGQVRDLRRSSHLRPRRLGAGEALRDRRVERQPLCPAGQTRQRTRRPLRSRQHARGAVCGDEGAVHLRDDRRANTTGLQDQRNRDGRGDLRRGRRRPDGRNRGPRDRRARLRRGHAVPILKRHLGAGLLREAEGDGRVPREPDRDSVRLRGAL